MIEEDENCCSICLCDMLKTDDIYEIEKCKHRYHSRCLLEMYITSNHRNCPLCRDNIVSGSLTNELRKKKKMEAIHKMVIEKKCDKEVKNLYKKYLNAGERLKDLELDLKEKIEYINKTRRKYKKELNRIDFLERHLKYNINLKRFVNITLFACYRNYPDFLFNFMKSETYKNLIKLFEEETLKQLTEYKTNMEKELNELKEKINYKEYEEQIIKKNKIFWKKDTALYRKEYHETKLLGIPLNLI